MHFPAALYLPTDAFDVASNQVIGRRIAGRLLTRAFASGLRSGEMLTIFSPGEAGVQSVQRLIDGYTSRDGVVRVGGEPEPLVIDEIGAIHFPDPSLARWVTLRQQCHPAAFSLTGVIHTVCSEGALRGLGDLPLAPVYPWDAVVCTSTAGRAVVAKAFEHRLETMSARFHRDSMPKLAIGMPQLPVIPLAGPTEQPFEPQLTRHDRRSVARQQLGIATDQFVVAFVGRLSFHSKCHPLSLYRALDELASLQPDQPITLIECGHIFNPSIAAAYEQLRARYPKIAYRLVGGLQPSSEMEKWRVLAAADVFTSPADNLQETFGLTLLEAMMAELPLVVSDWDGYRDLVAHGCNGYLVPTQDVLGDLEGFEAIDADYSAGQINYDTMIGLRSLGVSINHSAYVSGLLNLISNPGLRHSMALASVKRLEDHFSPDAVCVAYRKMYENLSELRSMARGESQYDFILPDSRPSYRRLFRHYATEALICPASNQELEVLDLASATLVLADAMNQQLLQSLASGKLLDVISSMQANSSISLDTLLGFGLPRERAQLLLAAFHKLGIVSLPDA